MSVLKRQVNSSSEFSSFFSVIRYYSYENSQLMLFLFWTKRSHPLPNNLYKSYAKCIQKLYKTLKLYLFCWEMSYKLKLCMYKLYKIYTNVNRIIHAATDVYFVYTKPLHSLLFEFLHQQRCHLLFYFAAL